MFLQPISAVHPALPAWRQTRATRSVGTWAWPGCSMAVGGIGPREVGGTSPCRHGARGVLADGGRWIGIRVSSSGAGRCPKQGVKNKLARQSEPGMHDASTWLSAFVRLPHLQARSRLFVVCAEMCRCLWHVKNLLWQPPYSNFHKI